MSGNDLVSVVSGRHPQEISQTEPPLLSMERFVKSFSLFLNSQVSGNPCKYIFFYFQEFECNAEDLREINELGHGAYGYVYKMIHEPTGNIMAVKVS